MNGIALTRLMQLSSQALPIGGYSHSQGLESAIDAGVVCDEATLRRWILDVCEYCMQSFEIPCLLAVTTAWRSGDAGRVAELNDEFLATREAAELRAAAVQMGYSLRALLNSLPDLPVASMDALRSMHEPSLPCVWGFASSAWQIEPAEAVIGYVWSWAENQVLVAMKSMPLGQSAGQRVLLHLGGRIARMAAAATEAATTEMPGRCSNFAPGLAILSSQHESQYSRLFRS